MAHQTASFLSGKMYNVVFFQRYGTWLARAVPDTVRQTTATKKRSANFGIASSAGRVLRNGLQASIAFPKNRNMQGRVAGAISKWLGQQSISQLLSAKNLPFISQFCFNEHSSMSERFKVAITVSNPSAGILRVQIPVFVPTAVISAPAHCVSVQLIISAASCGLAEATARGSDSASLIIPYNGNMMSATDILLSVGTEAGSLMVAAAMMRYELADGRMEEREAFLPSSVITSDYYD